MSVLITTQMLRLARTLLLTSSDPVTVEALMLKLSVSRRTAYRVIELLKKKLPGQILSRYGVYSLVAKPEDGAALASSTFGFSLPEALLRGWVNPQTGRVPTHLGL